MRVAIAKIRLSSHIFKIERGRWGPNRTEYADRRCNICLAEIEDEFHCLIKCPRFNNESRGLLTDILRIEPTEANFLRFLKSNSYTEQRKLGLLCSNFFKEYREQM